MKYVKHFTYKEWNKFNKYVAPDNSFTFINFSTGKKESYDSLTMQEVLLSKYKIIIDGYEPKWIRRYHKITKVINMKNFDKTMATFDKSMKAFSKGVDSFEKDLKEDKKNHETLWGKSKKNNMSIWGEKKSNTNIWGDKKTRRKTKKSRNSLKIWNDDKKDSIW